MCTVTYLPQEKSGYILTSNRDEKVDRPNAYLPAPRNIGNQTLLMPVDGLFSGTWIACSDSGRTLCLLNGGVVKHIPEKSYKKSRGLVVLDAFNYHNAQDFIFRYDLSGIEPFTLIFIEQNKLCEIRWNGERTFIKNLNPSKPYIWSSVTLYSDEIINLRQQWFEDWLGEQDEFSVPSILKFHQFGGEGQEENNIKMNRNNILKTISITSINATEEKFVMYYEDLKSGQNSISELKLKKVNEANEN